MSGFTAQTWLFSFIVLACFAHPAAAFGAGNIASISKVEGQNWRHGDIEDTLLTIAMAQAWHGKKFDKLAVSRVYFGNWLRDYSQALDVGTVKYVSAEAIRLLLCILGFMTFGYGSGEFEVTAERLNVYRPEDHIDNPKNYADNLDARHYDRRLRGPVDERVELGIDPYTGMKNYIANERAGIVTSAYHVRRLFTGCIQLGRKYKMGRNKADLYEALRLMGTGLHCLEDFFAHSNYCELALIEMGETEIFSFCGRETVVEIQGARRPVYPVVTGTFGGVDFLHSVTGEVSDRMTQNEISELEGTLQQGQSGDTSLLRDLLDKIPSGLFGGNNNSGKVDELQTNAAAAQVETMSVSPRKPEEFTNYVRKVFEQVMPAIEFHDEIMKSITEAVEKIPVLPQLIEQLEDQLSIFVFSLIAPFVVPLIDQIKNELQTGSDEIIQSSEKEQHNVFYDDRCSDPTHSMLAKDHFSNILNEVAGQASAKMVKWVVPQLMNAIDNDNVDIERCLNRIIYGVMHHPAQRQMGEDGISDGRQICFEAVEVWWQQMDDGQREEYRRKLSSQGVKSGDNHREGVQDTGHGHGCSGQLKMRKLYGQQDGGIETEIATAAAGAIMTGASGVFSNLMGEGGRPGGNHGGGGDGFGGGGGEVGGLVGAAESLLEGVLGGGDTTRESSSRYEDDGSYTRTETVYGRKGNEYAQAEYTQRQYPSGREESDYRVYEQEEPRRGGHGRTYEYEERTETTTTTSYGGGGGGGYQERIETERRGDYGGEYERHEERSYGGEEYGGRGGGRGRGGDAYAAEYERDEGGYGNQQYSRRNESGGYGNEYEQRNEGRGYGEQYGGEYGGREERRDEYSEYERREEPRYEEEYERREERSYGGGGGGGGGYGESYEEEYERRY